MQPWELLYEPSEEARDYEHEVLIHSDIVSHTLFYLLGFSAYTHSSGKPVASLLD